MKGGWTKETALEELRYLVKATTALEKQRRQSEQHIRWVARTLVVLEEVFGKNSRYYVTFSTFRWQETGTVLVGGLADPAGAWDPMGAIDRRHQAAYVRQLDAARGVLLAASDQLERTDLSAVYDGKDTGPESSALVRVINIAERKLRKVLHAKPMNEKAVQDAFESLLIGGDVPHSRETERIEYSSKTYSPDFTLPKADLAVEIKLCDGGGREKAIIAEINDDILAYRTKYGNLLFVVYDLGFIRDVDRFCGSFEEQQNVMVHVVKH